MTCKSVSVHEEKLMISFVTRENAELGTASLQTESSRAESAELMFAAYLSKGDFNVNAAGTSLAKQESG